MFEKSSDDSLNAITQCEPTVQFTCTIAAATATNMSVNQEIGPNGTTATNTKAAETFASHVVGSLRLIS